MKYKHTMESTNHNPNEIDVSDINVLVRQQMSNAYNEFVQMIDSILTDESVIRVTLFRDGVPTETVEMRLEDDIPVVKPGIFKSAVYYDPNTLTFRINGSSYYTYDFSFISHVMEKHRQILEIVHALYVLKYANGSEDQIRKLTHKFKYLASDHESSDISLELSDIMSDDSLSEKDKME
jgi:hypothetical protein